MPCAAASCLKFSSQLSKLPVLLHGVDAPAALTASVTAIVAAAAVAVARWSEMRRPIIGLRAAAPLAQGMAAERTEPLLALRQSDNPVKASGRHGCQGSLSYPSPNPLRLIGKPMPSSGVWKMKNVAVWPVRSC